MGESHVRMVVEVGPTKGMKLNAGMVHDEAGRRNTAVCMEGPKERFLGRLKSKSMRTMQVLEKIEGMGGRSLLSIRMGLRVAQFSTSNQPGSEL